LIPGYELVGELGPGRFVYDLPGKGARALWMILEQDPVPIRSRRPDLPEELAAVIHRALEREPRRRFASVRAMRKALLGFLGS
jgi:serine/threonine-protein kinase